MYAEVIAGTLSGNNILPNGTYIEFDTDDYLGEMVAADTLDVEDPMQTPQENTQEELA
jgi:hypothetical protein